MGRRNFGSKHGKKGGPPFVQMFHWVLGSEAWRDLGPNSQAVYLALKRHYNGVNNGAIGLSCRQAAEAIAKSPATASRALQNLVAHGFIIEVTKGVVGRGSGYNLATEWLLTECYDDRQEKPATKLFLQWRKSGTAVSVFPPDVSSVQRGGISLPLGRAPRSTDATHSGDPAKTALHRRNTLTSSHIQGRRNAARGAAGPQERSKPRAALPSNPKPEVAPSGISQDPPMESATMGPVGDKRSDDRQPIQISESLRAILQNAASVRSRDFADTINGDRADVS
jgi:hypothetical protein